MSVLLIAGIIGMLLLSIAIVFFFLIYQKRLLAQQGKLLKLEAEHQKRLLNASLQAQEAERKRIAADLHDSVGSLLAATKMYVKQVKPGEQEGVAHRAKEEALNLIEETIVNIRSITHNLLPPSLERFGLVAAVEDLCKRLDELNQLNIQFEYNEDRRIPVEQEVALYRIVQELLNNTFKHAAAQEVELKLNYQPQSLQLTYRDDGKGIDFDWEERLQKEASGIGMGLKNIESRVNFLNAHFSINSQTNKGTLVQLEMALHDTK